MLASQQPTDRQVEFMLAIERGGVVIYQGAMFGPGGETGEQRLGSKTSLSALERKRLVRRLAASEGDVLKQPRLALTVDGEQALAAAEFYCEACSHRHGVREACRCPECGQPTPVPGGTCGKAGCA